MRSVMLVFALMGLTSAVPYNDAAEVLDNRATGPPGCENRPPSACTSLPAGAGPSVTPDTAADFQGFDAFHKAAANAVTPSNYVRVFQNYYASSSVSNYLTYSTLPKYDAGACAAKCDAVKGCVAFNLYFERNPITSTHPKCCPNPASQTVIKCALWGSSIAATSSKNRGQLRDGFIVVVAGCNGYMKVPPGSSPAIAAPPANTGPVLTQTAQSISTAAASQAATVTLAGGCSTPVSTPSVRFNFNLPTVYGETMLIYGGIPQLGNWVTDNAYAMSALLYTPKNNTWFANLNLAAGLSFEYKYFKRNLDYSITWGASNRYYTVPKGCAQDIVVNDQWL